MNTEPTYETPKIVEPEKHDYVDIWELDINQEIIE